MKALSLTQPWASLIAIGAKRIETRSWSTKHRGLIAIHAAKKFPDDCRDLCWQEPFRTALGEAVDFGAYTDLDLDAEERFCGLPRGHIIATARLTGLAKTEDVLAMSQGLLRHEIAFGNYSAGRFGFVLQDVMKLPIPIPCKGALGLWEVPAAIYEDIAPQLLAGSPA